MSSSTRLGVGGLPPRSRRSSHANQPRRAPRSSSWSKRECGSGGALVHITHAPPVPQVSSAGQLMLAVDVQHIIVAVHDGGGVPGSTTSSDALAPFDDITWLSEI